MSIYIYIYIYIYYIYMYPGTGPYRCYTTDLKCIVHTVTVEITSYNKRIERLIKVSVIERFHRITHMQHLNIHSGLIHGHNNNIKSFLSKSINFKYNNYLRHA